MAEISFVKTPEQLDYFKNNTVSMDQQEGLYFAYLTDPAALAKAMPAGMEVLSPVVFGYVTHMEAPTFCVPYNEAALMTIGVVDGQPGVYAFAFLLDGGDNGTFMGREVLSIPKKTADSIAVSREGDAFSASVKRHGIELLSVSGTVGEFNDPLCAKVFASRVPGAEVPGLNYFYRFAADMDATGKNSLHDVRLLACPTTMVYHAWENASIDIKVGESADDPWAALPVVKPLGGGWTKFDCTMKGVAKVVEYEGDQAEDIVAKSMAGRFDMACME